MLHLLESPQVTQLITRYPVAGDNFVEKGFPKFAVYDEGKPGYVYINKTQYFEACQRRPRSSTLAATRSAKSG